MTTPCSSACCLPTHQQGTAQEPSSSRRSPARGCPRSSATTKSTTSGSKTAPGAWPWRSWVRRRQRSEGTAMKTASELWQEIDQTSVRPRHHSAVVALPGRDGRERPPAGQRSWLTRTYRTPSCARTSYRVTSQLPWTRRRPMSPASSPHIAMRTTSTRTRSAP